MKIKKLFYIIFILFVVVLLTGCINNSLSINVDSYEKFIIVGDKLYLTTNVDVSGENVVWSSSNELVVTVTENGLVEAVGEGSAIVTATHGTKKNSIVFYVSNPSSKPVIEITGPQQVIVNKTIELKAQCTLNTAGLIWSCSNDEIATVDKDGTITGKKPGVVTIKVIMEDDPTVYKEIVVLVRTGAGVQDVIKNYIEEYIYVNKGDYDLTTLNEKVVNMVKKVEKSVIGIANYSSPFGTGTSLVGTGTGGIYKKEKTSNGYLYTAFTNHHVIEDAKAIKVYLGDIDEYVPATLVKSDEELDIAIITFEHTAEYDTLSLGSVGSVNAGDFIVAIGNPNGFTFYGSVTFGMVSSPIRYMKDSEVAYVQHDAPINPGNSGGPLFNLDGEVIGINTLKLAATDIEGMGFAIAMQSFLEYLK